MDKDQQALGEQACEKALKYELDYGCCPQCVLAAVQETVGIVDDQTIKASHGLSGGGGLVGEGLCGALSGGLLALSAKYGRDRDKLDRGRYINNFKKARELTDRFRAEFGGVTCRELQQQFTGRTYDCLLYTSPASGPNPAMETNRATSGGREGSSIPAR